MGQRIYYRVWQLWQLMLATPLSPEAKQAVAAHLTAEELRLFERFSATDQWHSYRVMQLLQQAGHEDGCLLAAALLHDIGKTKVTLHWWDRVWVVLATLAGPARYEHWGDGEAKGWRKGLVVRKHHPAWGAEMAAAAFSHPLTIRLILRHQDSHVAAATHEDHLLRLLQWADNQS